MPDARAPRAARDDEAQLLRSFQRAADPEALARALIDELSRDELALALAALTGQRLEDLAEVRDLRAFAHELVGVAAAGLLHEPVADAAGSVAFGQRLATALERAEGGGEDAVSGTAPRIFGVFPLEGAAPQRVFVKWYRADVPALLTFQELPVRSRDGTAFVRLDRPEGWPPGDYRLEIYTGGEGPSLLASGGFQVTAGGRRLVARFPDT